MKHTTDLKEKVVVQCIAATLLLWVTKMLAIPTISNIQHSTNMGIQLAVLLAKATIFLIPFLFLKSAKPNIICKEKRKSKSMWNCIGLLFPMMASSVLLSSGLQFVWGKLGHPINTQGQPKPQSVVQMLFLLLSLVILPAIAEEMIFRSEIQQRLLIFGNKTAVVCSAILFAVVHSHPIQMVNAFVGGIFLGIAALIWGVKASVFLHFINNFFALVFPWMKDGEILLFWILSAIVAVGCLLYEVFFKKERTNLD